MRDVHASRYEYNIVATLCMLEELLESLLLVNNGSVCSLDWTTGPTQNGVKCLYQPFFFSVGEKLVMFDLY